MDSGDGAPADDTGLCPRHFALALLLLMAFSVVLVAWRVQQFELDIARERSARQLAGIVVEIERAFSFGLSARDLAPLQGFLDEQRADDREMIAAWIVDESGEIAVASGRLPAAAGFVARGKQPVEAMRVQRFFRAPDDYVGMRAVDPLGRPAAQVWLVHDRSQSHRRGERVLLALLPAAAAATLVAVGVLLVARRFAGAWLCRRWCAGTLLGALALLVVVPIVVQAQALTRPLIEAQQRIGAQQLGNDVAARIAQAIAVGIPLPALPGVDDVLRAQLAGAGEISALALVDAAGVRLASAGRTGDWQHDPRVAQLRIGLDAGAAVLVGYPRDYADHMMLQTVGDLAFAVLVAGVLVWELARGVGASATPSTRAAGHRGLRLFVFVVALSEELLRPFLAPFAADAKFSSLPLLAAWSPAAVAGLPILSFMIALALAQPCGASLAGRFDLRRLMCASVCVGALALAATGLSPDICGLTLLRMASGASYGLSLVFAQTAILRLVPPASRARALADFATAIVAAGIAGPAFGAIIAERFGVRAAFVACALVYAVGAWLCRHVPAAASAPLPAHASSSRAVRDFLRERDALAVTAFAAIPARLLAAAMLMLITPLYLSEAGESTTVIGRVLPLYFVAFLAVAPWVARHSDRSGRRKPCVVAGCVISGFGCAALPWIGGVAGAALGCLLLGVGQAALSAPQMAWVAELCARRGRGAVEQGVAAFRFLERLGSIAAVPVVAFCAQRLGLATSFVALGGAAALAGLALLPLRARQARTRIGEEAR